MKATPQDTDVILTLDDIVGNIGDMAFKARVLAIHEDLQIKPGEQVLDCGCGEGYYLSILPLLHPQARFFGCDHGIKLLKTARAQIAGNGSSVAQADIYALPFPNATFDKIILSEVLEHLSDDVAGLREVARTLKPAGRIVITVPNHNYPLLWDPLNWLLEAAFGRHIRSGFWAGIWNMHLRLYYPQEAEDVVRAAGLSVVAARPLTHYCIPFAHLVMHAGKRLLNSGAVPAPLFAAADKFEWRRNRRQWWNPVRWWYALMGAVDALNRGLPPSSSSVAYEIVAVKA